jgi:hypothetical protein
MKNRPETGVEAVAEAARLSAAGFQDRGYEKELAKATWWLQLADHWNERDPKFAELLRMRAREIQRAENERAKLSGRCLAG